MTRRISNLAAEVQLCEIDKEKLRQLREDAETRRSEAEAKHANAEVELARSRAAINRLASLETDLHRVIASKEAGEERHRAEIRASTSEAESRNAKLTAEVGYYKQQLDKKREKKRLHLMVSVEPGPLVHVHLRRDDCVGLSESNSFPRAFLARGDHESAFWDGGADAASGADRRRDAE